MGRLYALAGHRDVIHSILLPALIVLLSTERLFLAIADRLDSIFGHALLQQCLLQGFRTAGTQCQVVFFRSPIVAMTFQHNFDRWMLHKKGSVTLGRRSLVAANLGLVVIEHHVSYVLREQLFVRGRGSADLRNLGVDGHTRRSILCPPRPLCHEGVSCRASRLYRFRAGGWQRPQSLNTHIRCILSLPGQHGALSLLNLIGTRRQRGGRLRSCWRSRWCCLGCFLSASGE